MTCPHCKHTLQHVHKRALLQHALECDGAISPALVERAMLALKAMKAGSALPEEPAPPPRIKAHIFKNQPQQYVEGIFRRRGVALTNNFRRAYD